MRRLREELARALEQAGAAGPQEVFDALCAHLSERRGRPVVLHLVDFPPQTASGLYLDMTDRDLICVQADTDPLHQLIIFGHEVWHMVAGHGGHPPAGATTATAARSGGTAPDGRAAAALLVAEGAEGTDGAPALAPRDEEGAATGRPRTTPPAPPGLPGARPSKTLQSLAARTDFRQSQETEAETFGLELGAHLRRWLERTPGAAPRGGVAQRIQDSLGHRQV